MSRDAALARLRQLEQEWIDRGHGVFAVLDRETGAFLGRVGLHYWPQFDETEVGWILKREAWGRGYATEAARACVDFGFATLDVPYLTAMIAPANKASLRVAARLGMERLRDDLHFDAPVIVHGLVRPASHTPQE